MSNEMWTCSCGTENEGKICKACGKSKSAVEQENKAKEVSHEERDNYTVEEWSQKVREYNAKMEEYNEKVAQVPPKVIKEWAGSWIVLVLSICASVAVLCSLVSLFLNLGSFISIISAAVKLLLNSLVCAGFWRSYMMGAKKNSPLNSGGVKMLKGVVTFYQVIVCLVAVLIIVLYIFIFAGLKSCADKVTDSAASAGTDLSEVNNTFTGILIGILVALIIAFIVIICFFVSVKNFAKEVIMVIDSKSVKPTGNGVLAVLFFIIGGFMLITAIGSVVATGIIRDILGEAGNVGDKLLSSGLFDKKDFASMFSQLANAGMFIFGGILALKFGGLAQEVVKQRNAIEVPKKV